MSPRTRILLLLLCVVPGAAEPLGVVQQRSLDDEIGDSHLPARPFVRLGVSRLQQEYAFAAGFAPDGRTLAIHNWLWDPATENALWDLASGRMIRALRRHPLFYGGRTLAYSPDGKLLAGQGDYCIRLWEPATGREVRTIPCPQGAPFHALAFSPDGKALATSIWAEDTRPAQVVLWETATGRELRRLLGPQQPAGQLAFSADGKRLAGLESQFPLPTQRTPTQQIGSLVVWDTANGKQLVSRARDAFGTLSPDGRFYTLLNKEGRIEVHSLDGRGRPRVLECSDVRHGFSTDGKLLACVNEHNTIRVWNVEAGRLLVRMKARCRENDPGKAEFFPFCFSRDSRYLATGCDTSSHGVGGPIRIHLWDVVRGEECVPADAHFASVTCAAFSADARLLATGSFDRTLLLWDTADGRCLRRFSGHSGKIEPVSLSPGGRFLASHGKDKKLRLWDAGTGRSLHCLDAPAEGALSFAFVEERVLQWWDESGVVHRYEVESGKKLDPVPMEKDAFPPAPPGVDGLTVLPRAGTLANYEWPDTILPLPLQSSPEDGETVKTAKYEPLDRIHVSPDGRMAATVELTCAGGLAGSQCRIRVWETATGELIADLGETSAAFCAVAFSVDGWGLFSARDDQEAIWLALRGWDLVTGRAVHRFQPPRSGISCLTVSPDGTKLAAGSSDAAVRVWDIAGLFQPERRALSEELLAKLWTELGESKAQAAYRSMYRLAGAPGQAAPFLHRQLRAMLPPGANRLRRILADLDDDDFRTRENASQALVQLGGLGEPALRRALKTTVSLEAQHRIERLLTRLPKLEEAARLQVLRGICVLERIGTEPARAALSDLERSGPGLLVGLEAHAALRRLAQRPARP